MKILIFLLFPVLSFSQMTGIAETDSLLILKDKLFLKNKFSNGKYQLEYDWVDYQWKQWLRGKQVKKCIFKNNDGSTFYADCPEPYEVCINQLKGDTLIHIPKHISWEGFIDYRIEKIIQ